MRSHFSKILTGLLLTSALAAGTAMAETRSAVPDQQLAAKITQKLQKDKKFRDVRVAVQGGIVSLQGTVERYADKLKAEREARHTGHVASLNDQISVAGVALPDAELQDKLARKLAYDRVGYGHVFNALALRVKDGVATVSGEVLNSVDRDSALSIVQNQPGVKDVVDRIQVLPTSPFDDDVRLRTLRAIYGDPVLSRYAMDPQAPIRIIVDRGHVTLYGVVDNALDKQVAGMRANQVFGAFSVDNELVARNQERER